MPHPRRVGAGRLLFPLLTNFGFYPFYVPHTKMCATRNASSLFDNSLAEASSALTTVGPVRRRPATYSEHILLKPGKLSSTCAHSRPRRLPRPVLLSGRRKTEVRIP
ncbi:hypothetical protein F442_12437 [Phytophthora nicotianae P10297]|uniref:Secreted protein n=2 Tax=Phytophthora nicotianae TaxID=4792 RepID=W2PZX5_PHYN3|nr:hypothetical protein PPTG_23442 [Phytophthora nicotianae INRA-310]ETN05799.1 hypothetical protein PPTG_23442 [Phytophthora nicotianae INRA-310]ETP40178.1 hypothetical protein F442_12437 [Phytophthora nicotianae P10297]